MRFQFSRKRAQFAVAALSGHGLDDIGGVLRPLGRSEHWSLSSYIYTRIQQGPFWRRTFQARNHAPIFILIVHRVLELVKLLGLHPLDCNVLERKSSRLVADLVAKEARKAWPSDGEAIDMVPIIDRDRASRHDVAFWYCEGIDRPRSSDGSWRGRLVHLAESPR